MNTLFVSPKELSPFVSELANRFNSHNITAICGPLMGGAFLAHALATELNLRFYFTEPIPTPSSSGFFNTAYGLPKSLLSKVMGERIAVVDDMISAGSSVRATIMALTAAGASIVTVGTFILLGNKVNEYFLKAGINVETLLQQEFNLWEPENCPLCKGEISLEDPIA
ncbi:MAG: phosphoribosyltransferase family protein [Chitinophagaceae bacterium]